MEIIEIGAVVVERKTLQTVDEFCTFIQAVFSNAQNAKKRQRMAGALKQI